MTPHDSSPDTTQRTLPSGGPLRSPPRTACVVVIHGEGLGRRADIGHRPVLVGRSQEADLHIAHRSVSREHCRIWRDGDEYRVHDLRATNTTRVNDQIISEATLTDGDHIAIGESILKFISHTSVEARYHEEIYQLATHDALTELYNRRHFSELIEREIARALRHQRPLALCIIDVDLFKPVNDRYGHATGDGVLQQIALLIHRHVRNDDIAARIGGEEFAVLLPECDNYAAGSFAERLREAIAATRFAPGGEPRQITVSIGIAALSEGCGTRSRLMAAADAALYRAKSQGRNRVCLED
ncbi:diguanylate cyclase (GGDEF)-like protein [Luteimonas cucumeris]|uniref:diguanylate cyclase n=1 Tax=Luteimonas cucumeris TaxID=985012 RepID=A0A562L780_9GAMM|nr:GGDEF domain-containing protein [Luteimonas cucumeris]TWI03532.1 diguanylate cyclase (GGDEF)-like protein [Luteimonas cucumeris]